MPMCSELFFGDLSWQSVRYEYNALRIGTIVRVLRVLSPGGWLLRVVRLRGGKAQGSRHKEHNGAHSLAIGKRVNRYRLERASVPKYSHRQGAGQWLPNSIELHSTSSERIAHGWLLVNCPFEISICSNSHSADIADLLSFQPFHTVVSESLTPFCLLFDISNSLCCHIGCDHCSLSHNIIPEVSRFGFKLQLNVHSQP
jgi:hypothetical protein